MNHSEAKFILRAYRPDGPDAQDSVFQESLAQAERDPVLSAWLARERAVDAVLTARLAEVPVPDLRATILAGVRAGQQRMAWWRRTVWLTAAAAAALLVGVGVRLRVPPAADAYTLTRFARQDLATEGPEHLGAVAGLASIQTHLGDPSTRLTAVGLGLPDLADLRRRGCRTLQVAGHEVAEICFARGAQFHLYVALRGDFDPGAASREPMFGEQGGLASATWSDSRYVYVAVTQAGPDALRRIL